MNAPATSWKSFRITPEDVLFFRNAKPSTQGEDHYLESIFPPNPTTLYGALRTRRLVEAGIPLRRFNDRTWSELPTELRAELGEFGGFGSLSLRGPWLEREGEVYWPLPLDLSQAIRRDVSGIESTVSLRFLLKEGALNLDPKRHSHSLALLDAFEALESGWKTWREPGRGASTPGARFLSTVGWRLWQRGGVPPASSWRKPSDLWLTEPRTGIGLEEKEQRAADGMLFTFGFIRLQPGVHLGCEVTGAVLSSEFAQRFGGDAKMARFERVSEGIEKRLEDISIKPGQRFRVALLSHAISSSGAFPPGFGPGRLDGTLAGRQVRLVHASVPGFVGVGGWDLRKQWPKDLQRAIPAGSVFGFQLLGDEPLEGNLLQLLDPSASDPAFEREGYGLAILGREPEPNTPPPTATQVAPNQRGADASNTESNSRIDTESTAQREI